MKLMVPANKLYFALAKQEDDEVVLQIIYVYFQLCKHPTAMDYLIKETGKC